MWNEVALDSGLLMLNAALGLMLIDSFHIIISILWCNYETLITIHLYNMMMAWRD